MSTVFTPLFSTEAQGSIGKQLTYSRWKGIRTCRTYSKPTDPGTSKQLARRAFYTSMRAWWNYAFPSGTYKSDWAYYASHYTDFNMPWNETVRFGSPVYTQGVDKPWIFRILFHPTDRKIYFYYKRISSPVTAPALPVDNKVYYRENDGLWHVSDFTVVNTVYGYSVFQMTHGNTYEAYMTSKGIRISGNHREYYA